MSSGTHNYLWSVLETINLPQKFSAARIRHALRADHIKGCVEDNLLTFVDIPSALNPSDTGSKPIISPDVFHYLGALQHGKIRLGTPRSDFSTTHLRELMETSVFHSPLTPSPSTSRR